MPPPSLFLALGVAEVASAWDAVPCPGEHRLAWKQFKRDLSSTTDPQATSYVPHPFPKNVSEAWQDFLFYHRRAFAETPSSELRPTERRFFEVVDGGRAEVAGRRVVNWTQSRCGAERERAFYFLLSVTDEATGMEITRVAVDQSGFVHSLIHRPLQGEWQDLPKPVQDLGEAEQHASAILRSRPGDAQYVATTGTLRCDVLLPCVALREGGRTYLRHPGRGLYRLDSGRGLMKLAGGADQRALRDVSQELRAHNEHLVSLNAESWVVAVPVEAGADAD